MMSVIPTNIPDKVIRMVEDNRKYLVPDVSNYAKGRMRAWIGAEAPLTDAFGFKRTPIDYHSELWEWLQDFCANWLDFEPELGLLHVGGADCSDPADDPIDGRGGECGITRHRDASYADYRAAGINVIGEATFGYQAIYPHMGCWSPEEKRNVDPPVQLVHMTRGTCVMFNCKNPHFAEVGPNRWCINAWRVSAKRRAEFEAWKRREQ